jgi:hypothetical protein
VNVLKSMLWAVPSPYSGITILLLIFVCIYVEATGHVSCGNYHKTTL